MSLIEELCAKLMFELDIWVLDWVFHEFWVNACENRLGIWYFRPSEWLSLEWKH